MQKTFDMIKFAYEEALVQFPKSEKFALGTDRAVNCNNWPLNVNTNVGVRLALPS